jgi:hypothetical protein
MAVPLGQKVRVLVKLSILILTAFLVERIATAPDAYGIPAFARKYQTSCSTCHSNFPELNDFGEAFKKNGFKFPQNDEQFVKEPPVMLGAKAQRMVFPKAIYPGEIPGTIPIGFRYNGFMTYNSKQPLALGFVPRTDLFTPNTFTVISAGTFGDGLSFWIDDDISAGGSGADGGLGDGYLKVNDLGHKLGLPKDALNLRFASSSWTCRSRRPARSIQPITTFMIRQASPGYSEPRTILSCSQHPNAESRSADIRTMVTSPGPSRL